MEKLRNLEALVQEEARKRRYSDRKESASIAMQDAIRETKQDIKKAFRTRRKTPVKLKETVCG
jgi:hypothetical protein